MCGIGLDVKPHEDCLLGGTNVTIKKIEYCLGNLDNGSKRVFDMVQNEYPEVKQQRWGCLGNCAECFKRPFVLIDDREFVAAETADELLAKVRALLQIVP